MATRTWLKRSGRELARNVLAPTHTFARRIDGGILQAASSDRIACVAALIVSGDFGLQRAVVGIVHRLQTFSRTAYRMADLQAAIPHRVQ